MTRSQLSIEANYSKNKPISLENKSHRTGSRRTPNQDSSEGTISTKKVSWTKFPQEAIEKFEHNKWSKSQATQELEPMTKSHKPNKSAVYDKIYENYLKGKPENQLEIDRKFRMHRQKLSSISGEIKSLHTYKNSLLSGGNFAVSEGYGDSQQNCSVQVEEPMKPFKVEEKSEDVLIQIKGETSEKPKIAELDQEKIEEVKPNMYGRKMTSTQKKRVQMTPIGVNSSQNKFMFPRRSSLDLNEHQSKYASTGNLFYPNHKMFLRTSTNQGTRKVASKRTTSKDIKIDVIYKGEEPENIKTSEAMQREKFNRAVSRGRARRGSDGVNSLLRRRSMSKSILESIKLRKSKDKETSEEKEKEKKKRKIKFTEPIFKKEDLIEAYESLMKEKNKNDSHNKSGFKKEKNSMKKPIKPKTETKRDSVKRISMKKKSISGFDKTAEQIQKRMSSPILYKDFKRGMTQFLGERGMKKNTTIQLKKVSAKIDTGLQNKEKMFEDEAIREKRRVKKDYTLDRIVLPEVTLEIDANLNLFMAAQDMTEILMVSEPAELEEVGVEKVDEDNMDYVSDFDAKDHINFHQKNILSQCGFDFGQNIFSQTTNTCSEVNHEQPQNASLIYQPIDDSPQKSAKFMQRKQRKKNLHEKRESIVINQKKFTKKKR